MKLTKRQQSFLSRDVITQGGEPFILCLSSGDDVVARNLSAKGLGRFVDNGWRYPWRNRGGYSNIFYPKQEREE